MEPIPDDMKLIGPEELAAILGRAATSIKVDVTQRPDTLPPPFKVGIQKRYRPLWRLVDVRAWMERVGRESVERAEAEQAARAKAIVGRPKDW